VTLNTDILGLRGDKLELYLKRTFVVLEIALYAADIVKAPIDAELQNALLESPA
jgi:hypothetical protein